MKYFFIVLILMFGNAMGWYACNLQFFSDFWKDKPIMSNIIFGLPSGISYWYATRLMMEISPELWTARFIGAVVSYTIFPLLTWYHLDESMFTTKTMLCVFLAFCILMVQLFVD